MRERRVAAFGVLAWLVLGLIIGHFWSISHVEKELQKQAETTSEIPGSRVEFNGRDGYLYVPRGTDPAKAKALAHKLANQGSRDVEVRFDDAAITRVDLSWTGAKITGSGTVPAAELAGLGKLLKLDGLAGSSKVSLSTDTSKTLGLIFPTAFDDFANGKLKVRGDVIELSGTVDNKATFESYRSRFGSLANVKLDIQTAQPSGNTGPATSTTKPTEVQEIQKDIDALLRASKIEFVTGTATPTPTTAGTIEQIANLLKDASKVGVDLVGFTDDQGDDAANLELSRSRAQAVLDGLVARGVAAKRITATGQGEANPIATNETSEGRQTNRRVEFKTKKIG